jgi:RNA-directed DNA polymerase
VLLTLNVPALEDRLVQLACAKILASIFEADFVDTSYGYRPYRSAREAIEDLQFNLHYGKFGYIVEADIRSFLEPSSYCTPFHERI